MSNLDITMPKNYNLYNKYLDRLKIFYDRLSNNQYQHKIMTNGDIYYKEITASKWIKITPPQFRTKDEVIERLQLSRQKAVDNAQSLQINIFLLPEENIKSENLVLYNEAIQQIKNIDAQISNVKQIDIGDIQDKLLDFKVRRLELSQNLSDLLLLRQTNYTFKGETLKEYHDWFEGWKNTTQYTEWKKANNLYHINLGELSELDQRIAQYINIQNKLSEFNDYHMISPPEFEESVDLPIEKPIGKVEVTLKPKPGKIQPKIPPTIPPTIPKEGKIILVKKSCKSNNVKASKPGYVCNPVSGMWLQIAGPIAKEILNTYPIETLTFSKGTDITPYQKPITAPQIDVETPDIGEVIVTTDEVNPIEVKPAAPPLTGKVIIKPKLPLKCKANAPNALKPGYVCNPGSSIWIKIDGVKGKEIISENKIGDLHYSKGTDLTTISKQTEELATTVVDLPTQPLPNVMVVDQVLDIEPVAPKKPVAPKIPIQPKIPTSKKDIYLDIINKTIQTEKQEIINKLKPTHIGPILRLLTKNKVKAEFPAVRTFITSQKQTPAYKDLLATGINYNTLLKIITTIYKKITTETPQIITQISEPIKQISEPIEQISEPIKQISEIPPISTYHQKSTAEQKAEKRVSERVKHIRNTLPKNTKINSVLDIGAGNAEITDKIAKTFNLSKAYAMDVYPAIEFVKPFPDSIVEYKQVTGETLPFADHSIDMVTAFMSIHHIPNSEKLITEICRVLKPNGFLFFREHDVTNQKLSNYLDDIHSQYHKDPHEHSINPTYYWSKTDLFNFLIKQGFKKVKDSNYSGSNPQAIYHSLYRNTNCKTKL